MFMYISYVKHNFSAFPEIIKVIDSSTQLKLNEAEKEIEEQKVRKSCKYCFLGNDLLTSLWSQSLEANGLDLSLLYQQYNRISLRR